MGVCGVCVDETRIKYFLILFSSPLIGEIKKELFDKLQYWMQVWAQACWYSNLDYWAYLEQG